MNRKEVPHSRLILKGKPYGYEQKDSNTRFVPSNEAFLTGI